MLVTNIYTVREIKKIKRKKKNILKLIFYNNFLMGDLTGIFGEMLGEYLVISSLA